MNVQLTVGLVLMLKQWVRSNGLRAGFFGAALGLGITGQAFAANPDVAATQTALTISTNNSGPRTKATLTAQVSTLSGPDVTGGIVNFQSGNTDLGSAIVDSTGKATLITDNLAAGNHTVVAVYQGDSAHSASISPSSQLASSAATVAGFTIAATPTTLNVTAGAFASTVVTITPANGFNAYVNLSCSELPINTTCNFSPTNVLASCTAGTAGCTPAISTLQIQTLGPSGTQTPTARIKHSGGELRAYAFALPLLFGLSGGLAGLRRDKYKRFSRAAVVLLLFTGIMGITACKEQYNYFNHGPTPNPGTPPGTYSITINSVSTTGSLITTPPTSPQLTLTVK
jgi:hypothetical protein